MDGSVQFGEGGAALGIGQTIVFAISDRIKCPRGTVSPVMRRRYGVMVD